MVALPAAVEAHVTAPPAICECAGEGVLAGVNKVGHVEALVHDPVVVVSPAGCQLMVADTTAIEPELVDTVGRRVDARPGDVTRGGLEAASQVACRRNVPDFRRKLVVLRRVELAIASRIATDPLGGGFFRTKQARLEPAFARRELDAVDIFELRSEERRV